MRMLIIILNLNFLKPNETKKNYSIFYLFLNHVPYHRTNHLYLAGCLCISYNLTARLLPEN